MLKPINELSVRITSTIEIPDPANVQSSGDWYLLDHVSGGLAFFDSDTKKFSHLLASEWSTKSDGTHWFKLNQDAKFHDGTPITAKDVVWSLKRQLLLKSSTHFPLWDYIIGCENLKNLDDSCAGLKEEPNGVVAIRLKSLTDSFYLQLASPETGIWWAGDVNPITLELKPTKFSGAYYAAEKTSEALLLKKNMYSPLNEKFPDSPLSIRVKKIPLAKLDEAILNGEVDVAIRSYNPLGERDWKSHGIKVQATSASTIIYLFGLGLGERAPIGQDFIQELWRSNRDQMIKPSDTFLPFGNGYNLSQQEFLGSLPQQTASKLRILCPEGFFAPAFLAQIKEAGRLVGTEIEFYFEGQAAWFAAFNDPQANKKYDYIMSSYAASERYPAVQLRYMTKKLLTPPIDLKKSEVPDLDVDRIEILQNYQK